MSRVSNEFNRMISEPLNYKATAKVWNKASTAENKFLASVQKVAYKAAALFVLIGETVLNAGLALAKGVQMASNKVSNYFAKKDVKNLTSENTETPTSGATVADLSTVKADEETPTSGATVADLSAVKIAEEAPVAAPAPAPAKKPQVVSKDDEIGMRRKRNVDKQPGSYALNQDERLSLDLESGIAGLDKRDLSDLDKDLVGQVKQVMHNKNRQPRLELTAEQEDEMFGFAQKMLQEQAPAQSDATPPAYKTTRAHQRLTQVLTRTVFSPKRSLISLWQDPMGVVKKNWVFIASGKVAS